MSVLDPRGRSKKVTPPRLAASLEKTPVFAGNEPEAATPKDFATLAIRSSPPWLVSMVAHLVLLLALALVGFPDSIGKIPVVQVTYAEQEGEQLIDDSALMSGLSSADVTENQFSKGEIPVQNPFAAPPELAITLDALQSTSRIAAPSIGLALTGREKGAREALMAAYGGTATTEAAVGLGLEWLKRNQHRDGTWNLQGPYSGGVAGVENRTAATAMALLAFQGNGHTHRKGEHREVVSRGIKALLAMQDASGNFFKEGLNHHRLYSQAMATIAVCELYGMTQDSALQEPAQRALNYAAKVQADDGSGGGGWRYNPGQDVDTSVTGWFVMALQSGRMAGLDVSTPALDKVSAYLDRVTADGSRYSYRPGERVKPSMTAEALLCRQYLGWKRDDPKLIDGVRFLLEHPENWHELDVYYWYYATQVIHHMGGEFWTEWNDVMRRVLPENQVQEGRERGSWDSRGDPYGYQGGRLYCTCLCIYMLEVYYRHLPIYQVKL